jgi:hypothetical protein
MNAIGIGDAVKIVNPSKEQGGMAPFALKIIDRRRNRIILKSFIAFFCCYFLLDLFCFDAYGEISHVSCRLLLVFYLGKGKS